MKDLLGIGFYMAVLLGLSLLEIGRTNDDSGSAGEPVRIDFEGTHEMPLPPPAPDLVEPGPPVRIDFEGTHEMLLPPPPPDLVEPGPPVRIDFEGRHGVS